MKRIRNRVNLELKFQQKSEEQTLLSLLWSLNLPLFVSEMWVCLEDNNFLCNICFYIWKSYKICWPTYVHFLNQADKIISIGNIKY